AGGREEMEGEEKGRARMGGRGWVIVGAFAATALLWMTEGVHKMPSEMAAVIGVTLLYLPGLFGFTWKAVQDRTIWGTYVLLAGAPPASRGARSSGLLEARPLPPRRLSGGRPRRAVVLIID